MVEIPILLRQGRYLFLCIEYMKGDHLFFTDHHVFKKDDRVFKKRRGVWGKTSRRFFETPWCWSDSKDFSAFPILY